MIAGWLRRLSDAGYQAFLIGESLMRADAPGQALRQMIAEFNKKLSDRAIGSLSH